MEVSLEPLRELTDGRAIAREVSDEQLMGRAQDDDPEAFAQLYDRHAIRAYRVARSVCSDPGRAEDAVQEGFLSIWRSRASYRPEVGSFQGWAMKTIRNRAVDLLRRDSADKRPELVELSDGDGGRGSGSPQDALIARNETDAMLGALRRLPQPQAEVIGLAFFGELTTPRSPLSSRCPKAPSRAGCASAWRSCARRWTGTARSSRSGRNRVIRGGAPRVRPMRTREVRSQPAP